MLTTGLGNWGSGLEVGAYVYTAISIPKPAESEEISIKDLHIMHSPKPFAIDSSNFATMMLARMLCQLPQDLLQNRKELCMALVVIRDQVHRPCDPFVLG